MKLQVIKAEQGYVAVGDDEIKEGDWYIDDTHSLRQSVTNDADYWSRRKDYKKVIATASSFKLKGIPQFELPSVSHKDCYTEDDMISAANYGYVFRSETQFPEHEFGDGCINNFKQHLQSLKKPKLISIEVERVEKDNLCNCYYSTFCKSTQLDEGVICRDDLDKWKLKVVNGLVVVINYIA